MGMRRNKVLLDGVPRTGLLGKPGSWERIFFDVELDFDSVYAMARKAALSSGGVAKSGPLRVIVRERRPEPTVGCNSK
jgi:hypothetical protein